MKGTVAPSSSSSMAAATCTGLAASSRARRCSIVGSMVVSKAIKPGMIRNRRDCAILTAQMDCALPMWLMRRDQRAGGWWCAGPLRHERLAEGIAHAVFKGGAVIQAQLVRGPLDGLFRTRQGGWPPIRRIRRRLQFFIQARYRLLALAL